MLSNIGGTGVPEICKQLVDRRIVGFQDGKTIKFDSGILSPGCYVNFRNLPSHPHIWDSILREAGTFLSQPDCEIETIASVATGGIAHGTALARQFMLPSVIVRKETKNHGDPKYVEGTSEVIDGQQVLVMEDIGSTGGSSFRAIERLRNEGAIVKDVLYLGVYGFPEHEVGAVEYDVNLHYVIQFRDMLRYANECGLVSDDHSSLIQQWLKNPRDMWEWPAP